MQIAGPLCVRLQLLGWLALIIATGLVWRKADLGLPFFFWKYGGSALWGAMVFVIVRIVKPYAPIKTTLAASALIAIAVEISRLYETPALDEFRLTLAGQLLLGRIFSLWNLVAYAVGIAGAAGTLKFAGTIRLSRTGRSSVE